MKKLKENSNQNATYYILVDTKEPEYSSVWQDKKSAREMAKKMLEDAYCENEIPRKKWNEEMWEACGIYIIERKIGVSTY